MPPLATAFVRIRPDMSTFQSETTAQVVPAAEKTGEEAGAKAGGGFLSKFGGSLAKGIATSFAIYGGAELVKNVVEEASAIQDAQQRLQLAVTATGGSWKKAAPAVSDVTEKLGKYGYGVAQVDSVTAVFLRNTGDLQTSLKLTEVAADVAAAKGIDLAQAQQLVSTGVAGSAKALKQFGITAATGTTQSAALAQAQGLLADQIKAAGGMAQFAASKHLTLAQATQLVDAAAGKAYAAQTALASEGLSVAQAQSLVQKAMNGSATAAKQLAQHGLSLAVAQAQLKDATTGSTDALNKLGIEVLPKSATAAQRAAQFIGVMGAQLGGDAAAHAKTFSGQVQVLKTQLEEAGAQIAQKLMPTLLTVGKFLVSDVVPALISFGHWLAQNKAWVLPLAAAIGSFVAALVAANKIIVIVGAAMKLFGIEADLALGPWGLIIAAVIGVAVALVVLYKRSATFRAIVNAAFNGVKDVIVGLYNWIKSNWPLVFGYLTAGIGPAVVWIVQHWGAIQGAFEAVWNWVVHNWPYLAGALIGPIGIAIAYIVTHWSQILGYIQAGWNAVISWLKGIPGMIVGALGNLGSILFNAGKAVLTGFLNGIKAAWHDVTSFVGGIGSWIAQHKGPLDVDRKLLQPAGTAIMAGFHQAMVARWSQTARWLSGIAPAISLGGGYGAPGAASAAAAAATSAGNGAVVNIGQVTVRSESDIALVAQRLSFLTMSSSLAGGLA